MEKTKMPMTATQAQQLYVAYFNRPADTLGLAYWMTKDAAAASAAFAASTEYAATYAGMSTAARVDAIYTNLFGRSAEPTGLTYWGNLIERGLISVSNAVTQIANGAQGTDLVAYNNKVTAATAFTAALDTTAEIVAYSGTAANAAAKTWLTGITTDATLTTATTATALNASIAGVVAVAAPVVAGGTFPLTTGVDTLTGGAGNDTFSGPLDSFSALDTISGGAGRDTLTVSSSGTAAPVGAKVTGIEALSVSTTGAGYTIDSTTFTDLTQLTVVAATAGAVSVTAAATTAVAAQATGANTVDVIGSSGNLIVTTGAGAVTVGGTVVANALTSATVTGGTTVAITDRSGTAAASGSTLTTVTIAGAAGDQTLTGKGITTVNLTNLTGATTVGDTTVAVAAGTRELTVNYSGVDVAGDAANTGADVLRLTDATATSLKINAITKSSFDVAVTAGAATAVVIDAAVAFEMQELTAGAAKTVGISGAARTTITVDTLATDVVVTSTSTGGVTLTQALTANQQYVGAASSGVDTISLGVTTKAITTGAGNDVITSTGTVGTGGSVDAGDGTDTIIMTTTEAEAADNNSTFNSKFKSFETLQVSGALAATADINLTGINSVSKVVLAAGGGHATTAFVRDLANNGTIQFNASTAGLTAVIKDAVYNTGDTLNIALNSATAATIGAIVGTGAETVNISAPDATSAGGTAVVHIITALGLADATTVNVTGNNGLTVTAATGSTKITNFNASGVVANGTADTAALLAVTYASLNTTATAAVSITGGAGDDILSGNAGIDTISGGAGADTIFGGVGQDVLTGGAAADVFRYNLVADAVGAAGVRVDKITDFVAGTDKINLNGAAGAGVTLLGVTITAATAATATMATAVADATTVASISDVYTALAAFTGITASAADGTATVAQVYTYANGAAAGTYLVINDQTAGFQAANDIVINITGLSGTFSGTDITYTV